MQADEDFNIKFVNAVKKHRCLYDKKVPEYRNKDFQEKSWLEIARETKESVPHCKERWRNLRACLSRYIKQQASADPQHKPYYLSEHMQFLLPFLKSNRPSSFCSNNGYGGGIYDHLRNPADIVAAATSSSMGSSIAIGAAKPAIHHSSITSSGEPSNLTIPPPTGIHLSGATSSTVTDLSKIDIKHSTSDQEDLDDYHHDHMHVNNHPNLHRPRKRSLSESDTASVNYVPDVQIEIDSPPDNDHENYMSETGGGVDRKRFKIDLNPPENPIMDFFRSILHDVHSMTPLQVRKFKIGVLELIDDVLYKYPASSTNSGSINSRQQTTISTTNSHEIPNGYWRKS